MRRANHVVPPLVTQLCFARSELVRCLEGVSVEGAVRRLMPVSCIGWIVGHLASQAQAMLTLSDILAPI